MSNTGLFDHIFSPLPDGWTLEPLQEVVDFQEGPGILAKDFYESGVPLLRLSSIAGPFTTFDGCNYLDPIKVEKKWNHFKLFEGDILLSTSGSLGRVSEVSKLQSGCICYTGIIRFRPKENFLRKSYIKYFLQSKLFEQQAQACAAGSVLKHFGPTHLKTMSIPVPPADYQIFIEKCISPIDNKIQTNTQTNQTLESIAQAIFKSWFVDFEPVKAKMAVLAEGGTREQAELAAMGAISGKSEAELAQLQQHNPEHYQQLAETAALFSSAMVESELGEIPEEWKVLKIESVLQRLTIKNRYTKTEVYPYGKTPVFEQGTGILLGYHNGQAEIQASPENPAFIFGDHTCVMHLSCSPFDISANVIPLKGNKYPTIWTYYAVLGKQEFQEYRRHWSELAVKDVIAPINDALTYVFERIIRTNLLLQEELKKESSSLAELRDSLLPKLLSGELNLE